MGSRLAALHGPGGGSGSTRDGQGVTPPPARAASIAIEAVSKSYGPVAALRDVSVAVPSGAFLALLGPSGSGKTTLLMGIAGFEPPDRGRILLDGHDLTRVPPHRRGIGMVFQRYALFPHLNVAENVAYALRRRGIGRAERERLVRDSLDLVHLAAYEDRMPGQLSGGQQQRVALARALVYRPPVLLMDEPLGALDRKLREQLQIEIKQLQRRLGTTVVFVTHDQQEALSMADRVALLRDGRVVQAGTPRDLYDEPANSFVADLIGEANVLPGVLAADGAEIVLRTASGLVLRGTPIGAAAVPGTEAELVVRPTDVRLCSPGDGIPARVTETVYAGETVAVLVDLDGGHELVARLSTAGMAWSVGDRVAVSWPAAQARLFPAETGR
jgi:spermidine/putrescine ABC transporter ATP-binding subunit